MAIRAFGHETAGVRADNAQAVFVSDSVACGGGGPPLSPPPPPRAPAVGAALPGGAVGLVGGGPGGVDVGLPSGRLHYDELELRGSFPHARGEIDRALQALARRMIDWESLLGETISLDRLPAALARAR